MSWKAQLTKATNALRDATESDTARSIAAKARQAASTLAAKAKEGAMDAAQAIVEANSDPSAFKIQFLNARLSIVSPSNGLEVARPSENTLVISDGENNGLIINAAANPAYVADTIGKVTQLNGNTYDLGAEDGINVVVIDV